MAQPMSASRLELARRPPVWARRRGFREPGFRRPGFALGRGGRGNKISTPHCSVVQQAMELLVRYNSEKGLVREAKTNFRQYVFRSDVAGEWQHYKRTVL